MSIDYDTIQYITDSLITFCHDYDIDNLCLAGAVPWAMRTNNFDYVNRIDVVSYYEDHTLPLSQLFATEKLKTLSKTTKETGISDIEINSKNGKTLIRFQSKSPHLYMRNDDISDWMYSNNILNVPILNNIYGRNFTINGLIFSLHNEKMLDVTKRSTKDIEYKNLRSLLPARLLIKYNPLAILKAIQLSIKYDLHIDTEIQNEMQDPLVTLMKSVSLEKIIEEIITILKIGKSDGIDLLKKFNLDRILLNPTIKDFL